ncbi:hypothetical protein GQ55_5G517800 [Panicum hallii var. hallii]|uniref:Uncharacterized protein n=1 Tax=Panicum hallii var. hallii TaxID=1504633 RepID=A0A2T7DSI9_9POAL|nr:hypothetical protein GQ55_5G517800 [Panicum hallii var. hallii]
MYGQVGHGRLPSRWPEHMEISISRRPDDGLDLEPAACAAPSRRPASLPDGNSDRAHPLWHNSQRASAAPGRPGSHARLHPGSHVLDM